MIADVKRTAEQKMKKTLETLKADLGKIRTGRAHTGLLDHITVDYYGTPTPIPQVANVTLIDARTIGVTPWDKKMAGAVEKAIRSSDLGLNPATQGEIVRVPMPPLTEERRRDLIKALKGSKLDLVPISQLNEMAYGKCGRPGPPETLKQVVTVIEYRDGTALDAVWRLKG